MTDQHDDNDMLFWNHVRSVGRRLERHFAPARAMEWFSLPHPDLGNVPPATMIANGRTEEVLALIDELDRGA